jgi:hypothetical protein
MLNNIAKRRYVEMTISNCAVEFHYESSDRVLVHAFDDGQMLLTFISREAIDDAWPDRRLTTQDRKTLVDRNIEVISELIAAKYQRGELTTYEGTAGQTFPQVTIVSADLAAVRHRLSDTAVLDMAAAAGYRRA